MLLYLQGLIIDGRRLNITVAVTKDKAHEMTLQKKTPLHKEKQSSRNLHLAREGCKFFLDDFFTGRLK